ncbi:hypothetical protein CR513_45029, partial [Mucuna pruriens]
MVSNATKVSFVLLVALVVIIPCLETDIGEFNNFLKAQTEEAYKIALDAYVPTLEDVTNELNLHSFNDRQVFGRWWRKQKKLKFGEWVNDKTHQLALKYQQRREELQQSATEEGASANDSSSSSINDNDIYYEVVGGPTPPDNNDNHDDNP